MRKSQLLIGLSVVSASFSAAHALPIDIKDTRCIKSSVQKIADVVSNYEGYKDVPGAKMTVDLGIADVTLLEMVKSQLMVDPRTQKPIAYFELRPVSLDEGSVYPRFAITCVTGGQVGKSFAQKCAMVKEIPHFGLDDFASTFVALDGDPSCASGQVKIKFNAHFESNSADVLKIKQAVLGPAGALAPALSVFFDDRKFFQSYYESVYNGWIKSGM